MVPRRGSVQTCVAKLASAGTQCAAANLKNNWQEDWVSNGMLWEAAEAPASNEVLLHKTAHQPLTQQMAGLPPLTVLHRNIKAYRPRSDLQALPAGVSREVQQRCSSHAALPVLRTVCTASPLTWQEHCYA